MERWTKRINDARTILRGSAVEEQQQSFPSKTGVAGTLGLEHLQSIPSSAPQPVAEGKT